jgi:hypothetical protein
MITVKLTGKTEIDYGGYSNLVEYGFTYIENPPGKPSYLDSNSTKCQASGINPTTGIFTHTITTTSDFIVGHDYHFRAYAVNNLGPKDADEDSIKNLTIRELIPPTITCYILKNNIAKNKFEIGTYTNGFNVSGETTANEEISFGVLNIYQTSSPQPLGPICSWNNGILIYDTTKITPSPDITFQPVDYDPSSWTLTETAKYECSLGTGNPPAISNSYTINAYFPYLWSLSQHASQVIFNSGIFSNGTFYSNCPSPPTSISGKIIDSKSYQSFSMSPTSLLKHLYLCYPVEYGTNIKLDLDGNVVITALSSNMNIMSMNLSNNWTKEYIVVYYQFSSFTNVILNLTFL